MEVSEQTEALLKGKYLERLDKKTRLTTRDNFTLPKVAATKTPKLDSCIKNEVSKPAKIADNELAGNQSLVLDSLAPLASILEADARGDEISNKQAVDTATAALTLIGNSSAQISHLRRSKLVSNMNKALLPLVEDDSNFVDAPLSLFRPEFGQRSKDHVEQVKAIRSSLDDKKFFRNVPPTAGGGGTTKDKGTKAPGEEDTRVLKKTECPKPQGKLEQINIPHTDIQQSLIIIQKRVLRYHIACQGVQPLQISTNHLAGRLAHHLQN